MLSLILALQVSPPALGTALPEVSVSESLDRAPAAVSATYSFQCGELAATLIILVPQTRTQSGVKVAGQPNAVAFLNGASVSDAKNNELLKAIRSVGILPEVTPSCSGGIPSVLFRRDDKESSWEWMLAEPRG